MNVIEIEERIEQLAKEGFKPADFIYDFIAAYDAPKAILKQLRQGQQNPSEIGGILWRRYMHYKGASKGAVSATIDELQIAKENSKNKVRYIISTDGDQFAARDLKSGETLNCDFSKLADHFGFFLPLANIERYKIADENPVDIKATGRLAKFYDSILEDNPNWRGDEKRHTLNHFMTQIVFCLFAEDTGIFQDSIFSETIKTYCENDTSLTQSVIAIDREVHPSGLRFAPIPQTFHLNPMLPTLYLASCSVFHQFKMHILNDGIADRCSMDMYRWTLLHLAKGLEDVDVPLKMARLKAWCEDINSQQDKKFGFVFVPQDDFNALLERYINGPMKGSDKAFKYLADTMTEFH